MFKETQPNIEELEERLEAGKKLLKSSKDVGGQEKKLGIEDLGARLETIGKELLKSSKEMTGVVEGGLVDVELETDIKEIIAKIKEMAGSSNIARGRAEGVELFNGKVDILREIIEAEEAMLSYGSKKTELLLDAQQIGFLQAVLIEVEKNR